MKHTLKILSNTFKCNWGIMLNVTIIVGGLIGVIDKFRPMDFAMAFIGSFIGLFYKEYRKYKKYISNNPHPLN